MAFGFGFNKQKVLNSAEKFVQQGKLQNAITEYEKILKADPKDLTVQNTVGDLYSRLGDSDKAVQCFKSVGDAYATQGFTVKAIAMYKKLSKLKSSLDSVLRLAELYTQQGLFNDARAQYKQVAEEFLRTGEMEQAARIFQKILEMDPENVAMRTKLAEVYLGLGKKTEAWQIFSAAADNLRARGATAAAEEVVQRMLAIEPNNSQALLLRGSMAFESGDAAGAIQCLEKVADLDTHADGLRTLLQAYERAGRLKEAGTLAAKLFSVHNDVGALASYADTLIASGRFTGALQIYMQYSDQLLAANASKMVETLHGIIAHVRGNIPALETLLTLLNKAGESTHLTELYELLGHACVQAGELQKARDYYLKLTQLEPQNPLHARSYQQVCERLGSAASPSLITVEEGASLIEELEATAPFVDQRYSDEDALAVRAALTDAELFTSYNIPAKALAPLLAVLPRAPHDLRLNQRLAALYTRAGRFAEAAACCRLLETLYHEAGHPEEATRYGELAGKYEARAAVASEKPEIETSQPEPQPPVQPELKAAAPRPEAEFSAPSQPAARPTGLFWHAPPSPSAAMAEASQAEPAASSENEIDLSDEWEGAFSDESTPEPASVESSASLPDHTPPVEAAEATVSDTVQEIRFYLEQNMLDQARAGLTKLEGLSPDPAVLSALEDQVAAAVTSSLLAQPEEAVSIEVDSNPQPEEWGAQTAVEQDPGLETGFPTPAGTWSGQPHVGGFEAAQVQPEPVLAEPGVDETAEPVIEHAAEPIVQHAAELVEEKAPEPAVETAAAEPVAAEAVTATHPVSGLGDFVSDLESSLGDDFLPGSAETKVKPVQPPAPVPIAIQPPAIAHSVPVPAAAAPPAAMAAAASSNEPPMAAPATPPMFTYQQRPLAPPAKTAPETSLGVDVAGMFGELKQELEVETATEGEDFETHYNLGVAFREMGLLDEAIGEFQKVCQAVDRGLAFPQVMQTYTWLAQCFLDKGVPEAAIRWYEKALQLPNLDGETRIALHYELASAYEAAQNKPAALKYFLEVYGTNIDYRDVAERIRALKS